MAASVPWRRTFVILWCGQFVALTGLAFAMFSVGTYVYHLYESPTLLGIALALPILPFVVASPIAGALVDRWGARRALVVSNVAGGLNLLILAALQVTGTFAAGRVMLFLWAAAGLKSMHLAAFDTAVPFVVPKRDLGRANGARMFLTGPGAVVGPVVAGPLLLAAGVYGITVLSCVCFGLSLLSLRYVRVPHVRKPASDARNLLGEFWAAWRYVFARRGLAILLLCLAAVNVGIGAAELLSTQLTLSFASEAALDAVLLCGALGLAVATLVMIVWGGPRRLSAGVVGYSLLFAGAMVLSGLRPSVPLLAVAAFLFLGATPIIIGSMQTLLQLKVEPHLLGRAAAIKNLFTDVPYMLANILSGVLAGTVLIPLTGQDDVRSPVLAALVGDGPGRGFALTMMVVGVLIAAGVLLAYRCPPFRNVERDLPDVTPQDLPAELEPVPVATGRTHADR